MRSQFRDPRVATVNRNFPTVNRKLPTVNRKFSTGNIKFSTADMGNKGKAIKASTCWFWKPSHNLSNKGPNRNSVSVMFKKYTYIDTQGRLNGCSRHITSNISYLSDYEPFDGGTPRQHNMYSIDLNNIVPHKDLTCLVAKASVDEGMLWHRRLGHLNFKTMNRLVRHNLVRGLPSKCFENNHTCNACPKGKQHKASCTKDAASQEVKKDVSSLRYIALPNWIHEWKLQSHCYFNKSPADQLETLTVETPIPTVSSPVPTDCFTDSQEPSSDTRLISKRVANQVETPSLDNILTLTNQFEDILGVIKNSDESNGVEADNVWTLVDCPKGVRPIGTKWVLKNKKDERGIIIINKARLVAQGNTQEQGIDYDEVFTPVARIEAIRLFLAYASFMEFTVYQIDVKSAFLYGTIDEEVYVIQPPRFQDPEYPARVYKVEKVMYGLHQAPRAWYGTLSKYLLTNGFQRSTIDQTLFIKRQRGNFILVQVYVDDIIFRSSNPQLCREFEALMHENFQMSVVLGDILKKFGYSDVRSSNTHMDKESPWGKEGTRKDVDLYLYRSMIGSLMYLTASRPDIMFDVYACARHQVTPKDGHLHAIKRIFRYLKSHPKLRLWYPKESPFDLVAYSDSDYGGATQDRKSTTEG
nr:hypothetical protein [Tanacetum cinerariifolium]